MIKELEKESCKPDFWDDPSKAQKTLQQKSHLEDELSLYKSLLLRLEDAKTLVELAQEEEDLSLVKDIEDQISHLSSALQKAELRTLLSGEQDRNNAIVSINPGAGGTESQDWAAMLFRMYTRWAENRGYKVKLLDYQSAEDAGIKGVTFLVEGPYAYGYLKCETGVHRLVRISPFDAAKRRHTSFASIFVYPEITEDVEVEVSDKDLKIETYRASGPGGQHVNVTDSAVRITHLPTGIVVQCQNERSQHKNKEMALKILKARLYEFKKREKEKEKEKMEKSKKEIAWGSQIRSYVLHPYRLSKDHRTGVEIGNVDEVLNGGLDPFIEAYLSWQREKGENSRPA
jgi:peptide chain release factor 2